MVNLPLRHGADTKVVDDQGWSVLLRAFDFFPDSERFQATAVLALSIHQAPAKATTASDESIGDGPTALKSAPKRGKRKRPFWPLAGRVRGELQEQRWLNSLAPRIYSVLDIAGANVPLRRGESETTVDGVGRTPAGVVGRRCKVNATLKDHLRRVLARAPSNLAWRDQRWLLQYRCYPVRAQLIPHSRSPGGDAAAGPSTSGGEDYK